MQSPWRTMDRATLDAAYSNGDPPADFKTRSAAFYASHPGELDVRYGPAPRERFDFFPASKADRTDTPTFVFVHGGYWQSCDKELCAFVALGPLARGMNVVVAEYTLAPTASMTQIVGEIGRLLDFLVEQGHATLILGGHSAGGHLTAMHRHHPAVKYALPVSGLFDLEPISAVVSTTNSGYRRRKSRASAQCATSIVVHRWSSPSATRNGPNSFAIRMTMHTLAVRRASV